MIFTITIYINVHTQSKTRIDMQVIKQTFTGTSHRTMVKTFVDIFSSLIIT